MIQTSLLVTKEKQTLDINIFIHNGINIFIHNDWVINFIIFDIIQYLCISVLSIQLYNV